MELTRILQPAATQMSETIPTKQEVEGNTKRGSLKRKRTASNTDITAQERPAIRKMKRQPDEDDDDDATIAASSPQSDSVTESDKEYLKLDCERPEACDDPNCTLAPCYCIEGVCNDPDCTLTPCFCVEGEKLLHGQKESSLSEGHSAEERGLVGPCAER